MNEYTPEKVAELVADNRKWVQLHRENKYQREAAKRMTGVLDALEDALTAVSADRDRLHKAITDIQDWMNNPGSVSWPALRRILRAALDKGRNDVE